MSRWIKNDGLLETLSDLKLGAIAFTPLAQSLLTNKFLKGIPLNN